MNTFLQSVRYALQGLQAAFVGRNFRLQLGMALLVLAAGFYFSITRLEWCVLLFNIALVLSLEVVNSSLENLVDLVTRERHPLAGKVKDLAAGAVVVASAMAVVMGVIVFWPYVEAALN
ncbi:diacylglycerol kinase family protein [Parachryseolinea silvisoli]|jgi:diacylglycerol kinase|uniref:diacylglycerol kinase family protein n=1 Tax=Parachryseolinea silvisoli TaxID=2873601 RepID=UPI0022658851|nr:diacylglycerol kinase family protein [Parachryseolinea silvisoli]MCD9019061.1 diacylglycerol kinase family protein [Parachryseolinea silvisoli]